MGFKTKEKTIFVCSNCGQSYQRWQGKCSSCGEWNAIFEEKVQPKKNKKIITEEIKFTTITACHNDAPLSIQTGFAEFDQLLGNGLVPDSSLLIGGEPGIGKSTLILQICGKLAEQGYQSLYLTGEESTQQVAGRGIRTGVTSDNVKIASIRELYQIKTLLEKNRPNLLVIDSIQTLYDPDLESAAGTVSQIRSCASELIDYCKQYGICLILIGHITKEGAIAGPKVLEHLVDVVLYFEGEPNNLFRILRVRKNRFGPTSEIGVFQISADGLAAVKNPSELFLAEQSEDTSGSVVVTAVEGQRPILLELQALASKSNYGFPQRVSSGFDLRRLNIILAILEKREKLPLGQHDVFVNLVGGLRVNDPALDLGLAAAIISSMEDIPIKESTVIIGELGLSGEIRAVPYLDRRINEIARLGFKRVILPKRNLKNVPNKNSLELLGIEKLSELSAKALS